MANVNSAITTPNIQYAHTFRQQTVLVADRFYYVTDHKAFGVTEQWGELRERGRLLYGDCEDFAITLARRCMAHGVPRGMLALHLVQIGTRPDHIVLVMNGLVADCNRGRASETTEIDYFDWISHRPLDSPHWLHTQHQHIRRAE